MDEELPWHNPGFLKLANVFCYLMKQSFAGEITPEELELVLPVLVSCGKLIRQEVASEAFVELPDSLGSF